uniref:PEROXIDASE_4 domain-containing protein n=1 Tax=Ascaris lumbricoides TaxID=6252 RepID=A0A0M3HLT3_ASCLU
MPVEILFPDRCLPFFYEPCKNLVLRMCNDLLKRLSRTVDTSFCGRILVLLARALPLCEKSGLNLVSHFNVDNVTKFDLFLHRTWLKRRESGVLRVSCPSVATIIPTASITLSDMREAILSQESLTLDCCNRKRFGFRCLFLVVSTHN